MMIKDLSNKSIGEVVNTVFSVIALFILILASLILASAAWEDWHLRQDLAREGVLTEATVQGCSTYKYGCTITYEFSIIEHGQVKKYVGEERNILDCNGCTSLTIGETTVPIRYIPQNPNRSGMEGASAALFYACFATVGFLIFLIAMVASYKQTIKSKVQVWWSERKR